MLTEILKTEPNLRISVQNLMQHKYFIQVDWPRVLSRTAEVPFLPQPQRFLFTLAQRSQSVQPKLDQLSRYNLKRANQQLLDF